MPPRLIAAPRRWMRGLYDWTLHWAQTPQSLVALFLIAFAESSFFPIPPDVLLVAIVAALPVRWLVAAVVCTAGSTTGAMLGYVIGASFMAVFGQRIIDFYSAQAAWDQVVTLYTGSWGVWFLAAAAFSPIPFKVATIAAGATSMAFWPFVLVSTIGRAARFLLVSAVLRVFGVPARSLIERHFDLAALLFVALLIGGFLLLGLL